jgi:ABC-type bacteriocin/lantibiotic exporter with double-glycine peptidase domain
VLTGTYAVALRTTRTPCLRSIVSITLSTYGVFCTGMALIILTIPLTGRVSMYLKTLQKALSSVRDERIKLTNEVLSGMKVIKLQAWEKEFENRIREVRERELDIFRK